jgi:hypothetical protein
MWSPRGPCVRLPPLLTELSPHTSENMELFRPNTLVKYNKSGSDERLREAKAVMVFGPNTTEVNTLPATSEGLHLHLTASFSNDHLPNPGHQQLMGHQPC